MPFGANAVLTMESNADEVWKYTDTNNDGVADKKELFATGFGRLANVEHQQSGLFWAMDNWLYSTVNAFRAARGRRRACCAEPTGGNGAQWGVTQDNYGKVWFQGGASGMPGYFQLPVALRQLQRPRSVRAEPEHHVGRAGADRRHAGRPAVGPHARRLAQRAPRPAPATTSSAAIACRRTWSATTSTAKPSRRIVRRLRPVKTDGLTQLRNVYPLSEFIRSTDPLFRPVDMTTAPDGTMYITDMYRGIIQEAQWSGAGPTCARRSSSTSSTRSSATAASGG